MKALVLSGGGSKGAYQAGALAYILGKVGKSYDLICGVSVGAINSAVLSMYPRGTERKAAGELVAMWRKVNNRFIYKPWFCRHLAALWRPSLYNSKPLHKNLRQILDHRRIRTSGKQLSVGAVSLYTGEYHTWNERDDNIIDAVLASSAFPGMLLPVEIEGELWTDGGIRQNTPVKDAIELGASEIDVILTAPETLPGHLGNERTFGITKRVLETLTDEIDQNDLKIAQMYNELLEHRDIEGKRKVPIRVLRPSVSLLNDPLDFTPSKIQTNMSRGYLDAQALKWT